MKILTLTLTNFQGIRELTLELDGRNANIYGNNATGKTTVYNAFTWLLFNKASTGAANFSPKTKDADGNDVHYLDHSVTAKLQLAGGRIIVLHKTLAENWVKKRGSNNKEFSGHNTAYEVDGVPVSENEYNARITEFIPQEQARILSNTAHFSEVMSWQERRRILIDVCGDVSDEDVINSDLELIGLRNYLKKPGDPNELYSADEALAVIKARMRKINDELEEIPARVDECMKAIPEFDGLNKLEIAAKISELEERRAELESEKACITESTVVAALNGELSDLKVKLNEAKAAHLAEENSRTEQFNHGLLSLQKAVMAARDQLDERKKLHAEKTKDLVIAQTDREGLIKKYRQKEAEAFGDELVCRTCGQDLPVDDINAARERFESGKEQYLRDIRDNIKAECSKEIIDTLEIAVAALQVEIDDISKSVLEAEKAIEDYITNNRENIPFEETDTYREINAKMSEIRDEMSKGSTDTELAKTNVQHRIDDVVRGIHEQHEVLSKFTVAASQQKRAADLAAKEKELAKEYEHLEKGIHLCELFIKTKTAQITDNINAKFSAVSFRLFVEQINGGIKEDCEVLVPGESGLVPYSTANNAARINAGIEIINVLSKHWELSLPLFVDNRESVVNLVPTEAQIISLIVSENNKKLNVEVI